MDKETKQYLEERFKELPTKADLANLATKEEVKALSEGQSEVLHQLIEHFDKRFDEMKDDLMPYKRDVESHDKRLGFLEDRLPKLAA